MEENILDYINLNDLNKIKGYMLIKSIAKIKKGGVIRYIDKDNYKFNNGGIVIEIKPEFRIIKLLNYKKNRTWHVYFDRNVIYYKKKKSYREIMLNMVNGLENNSVKITKVEN